MFKLNRITNFIRLNLIPSGNELLRCIRLDASGENLRRYAKFRDRRLAKVASGINHDLPLLTKRPPKDVVARKLQFLEESLEPDGMVAPIRAVWFIESRERAPRLATAYPLRHRT